VLFEVFRVLGVADEVRMQLCVGTSLAIILPTTLRSYRAHRARGLVIPYVLRLWAVPAILGVAVGSVRRRSPRPGFQGGVRGDRRHHRRPAADRPRQLGGGQRSAGRTAMTLRVRRRVARR